MHDDFWIKLHHLEERDVEIQAIKKDNLSPWEGGYLDQLPYQYVTCPRIKKASLKKDADEITST